MNKLKVLGVITEDSAVGYYRLWAPLKEMERQGLIELKLTPTFKWGSGGVAVKNFPDLKWFSTDNKPEFYPDILVAERHDFGPYIAEMKTISKAYKCPLVIDTDDDVQAVRPWNPGYASYNPNSDNVAWNVKLMSVADAIITSTEHLKERHWKYNKPTYVYPNSIDVKERVFEPKKRSKMIRIGWLGSACHRENLPIIEQAVKDILANHNNVEFIYTNLYGDLWSKPPPELEKRVIGQCSLNGCKVRHISCNNAYVPFKKYAKFINSARLDIGLAPLYDNLFNRSKSNLRLLEYWADKVAVIASPVQPYVESIKDGENGILAKEKRDWYNAIETLILDEKLRNKLKENGYQTMLKDYSLETNVKKLYNYYKEIVKNYAKSN